VQTIRSLTALIACALAATLALAAPAAASPPTCDDASGQAQAGELMTVHLVCSVEGGGELRYHATKPRHGILKLKASGDGVWQADPAYIGTDEFTYWAVAQTDAGPLKSNVATFRVRFERRSQPLKPPQFTLSPATGSVRVKLGGRWQKLSRARSFTQPVVVDALNGAVKLDARNGLDSSSTSRSLDGALNSGRFSHGMFKVEHGPAEGSIAPRQYSFNKIALTGSQCGGSAVRQIDGTVSRGRFTLKTAHFSATALARSRFTAGDLCVGVSVVSVRSGRVIAPGGQVLHTNDSYQKPLE
jgi:hypothetical protein